jgi:Tfp pilus assembly protein PilO
MSRTLLCLIVVAAVLVIGFLLYRSRSARNLDVDPHAREEIEKAKRR